MQITKGYIQGAFDGEGSLVYGPNKNSDNWHLEISNTDPVWLEAIAKYLKSRGYHPVITIYQHVKHPNWKHIYLLRLNRRAEIKRYLTEFPPLMAHRQKKATEFLLWDKQHRRNILRGSDSVIQQALDILKESNNQGRLL